jgi:hypothetical protein
VKARWVLVLILLIALFPGPAIDLCATLAQAALNVLDGLITPPA